MGTQSKRLNLGEMAFYWRVKESPEEDSPIPAMVNFEFGFRPELQLIIHSPGPGVDGILRKSYEADFNIGHLQVNGSLAPSYGRDFLEFILKAGSLLKKQPASYLEIGVGGGYVLNELGKRGNRVLGVDPSPVAARAATDLGLVVIRDFYPPARALEPVDLIYHYATLEHQADPIAFLAAHQRHLNPGGMIIAAVPNCGESIRRGDLSMIMHQHLAYFDPESLELTMGAAGYRVLLLEQAQACGFLYCAAIPTDQSVLEARNDRAKFDRFVELTQESRQRVGSFVRAALNQRRESLGFYVPGRAINYLSLLKRFSGFRFFDDDPYQHDRYYDGFDVRVERFEELLQEPVDNLLICSLTFGSQIAEKVESALGDRVAVTLLGDLLPGEGPVGEGCSC